MSGLAGVPRLEMPAVLTEAIKRAKLHTMTPAEADAQRRSFVRGQMGMSHPEMLTDELDALMLKVFGPSLADQLAQSHRAGILEGLRIAAEMAREHGEIVSNEPIGKACSRNIASAIEARAKEMGLAKE